ncbi:MAG TPA: efflux RND transporter permease subunit, partial [Polyangia bacterium]|nr:efflux RND transporter permease subunit [Polyangia bacterium]
LFREFAVTLSVAVAISALVSLTVTPTMAARLLRAPRHAPEGRVGDASGRFIARVTRGYDRALGWTLDHSLLMAVLTIATLGLTIFLAFVVPKGLFPQQDTGLISGFSEAAQDISSAAMRRAQMKVNAVVHNDPDVEHVLSFVGGAQGAGNTGTVFVALRPHNQRHSTADEIVGRLRPKLSTIPGINLFLQSVQDMRVGGRASRTQYQYALQDADLAELNAWSPKVLERFRKLPELRDVNTDQQTAGIQLDVVIDRDSAARQGVSMQAIDDTLYDAFGQRQVATSFTALNYYRVVLEASPAQQASPDQLAHVYVRALNGSLVPLSSMARFDISPSPLSINHQGQLPATTLSFNLAPGVALGQAVTAIRASERQIGLPATIHASFQGTAQAFGASLSSEPWLILAALFTVYVVLGILYESLIHPITIISTLPSAALGALIAIYVLRVEFSIIALIGVILLLGIVKKNAIMMIDFALEAERVEGLDPKAAIHRAALLRFRPILMTTLAALFGVLPMAVGLGAGSELRRPLGISIVGGLCVSQILNLFSTPVIYLYLDKLRRPVRREASPTTA